MASEYRTNLSGFRMIHYPGKSPFEYWTVRFSDVDRTCKNEPRNIAFYFFPLSKIGLLYGFVVTF
jgi:hypothetical protein